METIHPPPSEEVLTAWRHVDNAPVFRHAPKPFITVTGADEKTDVASLSDLNAEIGFLFTATPEGRNRYPRWEWIREASLAVKRAALHVCGRDARNLIAAGELPVSGFQRIQINGGILANEVERICAMYPRHTIITQHHVNNAHLLFVKALNHAVLIDGSGGCGVSPDAWAPPLTEKHVGFAGGLGPANLTSELGKIQTVARPGWWADMENKLRVDDFFSIELAAQCVEQFHSSTLPGLPGPGETKINFPDSKALPQRANP